MSGREREKFKVLEGQKNKLTLKKSIVILGVLILLFFSGQRFVKIYQQKQIIDQLQLQLENERLKNSQLQEEIENLQSPEGIERIAREQLGLVKENEIVIKPVTVDQAQEGQESQEGEQK